MRHYRLGRERIIQRIQNIHGDYVNFSQVSPEEIPSVQDRIHLECNICDHRWLPTVRSVIYSGTGCPNCYKNRRMSLEDFLERVKDNRLDYSLNLTFDYNEKITVACPVCEHVWKNNCYHHLTGEAKCPKCRRIRNCSDCGYSWRYSKKCPICTRKKDIGGFVRAGNLMHQNQYTYDQIKEYKDQITVQCCKCKHNIRTTMGEHLSTKFRCRFCCL